MTSARSEEFVEFGIAQYAQVLRRRWLPVILTILTCTGLSTLMAARNYKEEFLAQGKLLFQSNDPRSALTGVGADVGKLELDTVARSNPLENQANLLVSGALLEEVIKTLDIRNASGEYIPYQVIRNGIKVKQIPNTDILSVSYTARDPDFAADFVNVLMKSYLQFNSKNQKYNVDSARSFIAGQLPKLKADFERASLALKDFKAQNQVVNLNSKGQEISSLNAQALQDEQKAFRDLEAAKARIDALRSQLQQVGNNTNLSLLELSRLGDSPQIQQTLTEIQGVESELAVQSQQYTSDHPIIEDLRLKAQSLNGLLQAQSSAILGKSVQLDPRSLQLSDLQKKFLSDLTQAELELQTLQEDAQLLSFRKSSIGNQVSGFATIEKSQKELEQNLENTRNRYFQLLESLEKLDLTEVKIQESSQVQIIESAVSSPASISSFNFKIVIAGALLGMSLAFGLALLLDILDSKLRTVHQLENVWGYPVLGLLPRHEFASENEDAIDFSSLEASTPYSRKIITLGADFTPIYNAYQQIYINLTLLAQEKLPKTIGVTSSLALEGKSEIAANIAATLAQSGHQTLLVDASFRNPTQHKLWKLENNVGLTDVLYDSVNASLVRQKVAPNLYVITAGPAVANMSVISGHSEFMTFLAQASSQYDCVIFDSGPLLSAPDTISLCRACEGTLLVASLRHLQVSDALSTKALIEKARIPLMGVIVNQAKAKDMQKQPRAPIFLGTTTNSEADDPAIAELDVIRS